MGESSAYNEIVTLTQKEEFLVQTMRSLSPEACEKVLAWAEQLAGLADGRPIDWSDSWSEEDMHDATAASIRRFEIEEELE